MNARSTSGVANQPPDAAASLAQLLDDAVARSHARSRTVLNVVAAFMLVPATLAIWLVVKGYQAQKETKAFEQQVGNVQNQEKTLTRRVEELNQLLPAVQKGAQEAGQRLQQLTASVGAVRSALPKPGVPASVQQRIASMASNMSTSRQDVETLSQTLQGTQRDIAALRAEVQRVTRDVAKPASDPMIAVLNARVTALETQLAALNRFRFISYAVPENSETPLYDVGLRLRVGPIRNQEVTFEVLEPSGRVLSGGAQSVSLVPEGVVPVTFSDDRYDYQLIVVYFQKKWLARDVLGVALGRRERR